MFLYGILVFLALSAIATLIAIKRAPLGYEDESGFHYINDEPDHIINRKAAA